MPPDEFEHNFESATGQLALDRQPRVHVEYSVAIGNATVKKDIPFVMGVLAPLRGNRAAGPDDVPEKRHFMEITKETFDQQLKNNGATANIEVDNVLANDGSKLQLSLKFERMDDFSPAAVARKVEALKRLLDLSTNLKEVRATFGGNPDAARWLSKLIKDEPLLAPLRDKVRPIAKREGK